MACELADQGDLQGARLAREQALLLEKKARRRELKNQSQRKLRLIGRVGKEVSMRYGSVASERQKF